MERGPARFETLRTLREILDRGTQVRLGLATFAASVLALCDMAAIALVLPLVEVATTGDVSSGLGILVSDFFGEPSRDNLLVLLTVLVITLFVLKDCGAIAYTWWLAGFKQFRRVDLSTRLLENFLRAPYTSMANRSTAELLRTMNDAATQVYGTSVFGYMTVTSNAIGLAAIALALLISAPLATVMVCGYLGLAAVVYLRVMRPRAQAAGVVAARAYHHAYKRAFAALGARKETKLRGSSSFFVKQYYDASMEGARANRQAEFISAVPRYLLEILFILAIGLFIVIGTAFEDSNSGQGHIGLMALFVAAGFRALPAVTSIIAQVANIRFGAQFLILVRAEVERIDRNDWDKHPHESRLSDRVESSGLDLQDVSFRYPGANRDAISDLSLSVPLGTTLALVGGSGAGKTTLVDLILGLHVPTQGRILVDGRDISEDLVAWQSRVGYVPQDIFLIEGTLAENIAFDLVRSDIDEVRLEEAIHFAQLSELVEVLPRGVDSEIGERGGLLSGGQRQRIGIARALYRRPSLLVLDEATSALDNETEHQVATALSNLRGEITTVIVAHRLSTVRKAENVAFLREGKLDAFGSFEEVTTASEAFARMVRLGSLGSAGEFS